MKKGVFITFEGVEGCGKTTQVDLLAKYLKEKGHSVFVTREPGGTLIGDQIRRILLDKDNFVMTSVCELLLYAASRHQHTFEKIIPAVNDGKIVLCDRYADATRAYQGAARKLSDDLIESSVEIATGGTTPDLTLLFDLSVEEGFKRVKSRSKGYDRLEKEGMDFHNRVRDGYLAIAGKEPKRVKTMDAMKSIEEVHEEVVNIIFNYVE